jgi:hypothetical protein
MSELEVIAVSISTENPKAKEINQSDEVKVALIIQPSEEVDESEESVNNNWCPQTLAQTFSFITAIIMSIFLVIICLILIEGLGILMCFVISRYPPNWKDQHYYINITLLGLLGWTIIARIIKVCCFDRR